MEHEHSQRSKSSNLRQKKSVSKPQSSIDDPVIRDLEKPHIYEKRTKGVRASFNLANIPSHSPHQNKTQQKNTKVSEEQYRDRFEHDAANKAQEILQANRDRVNTEQAKYTSDQNPNSPHWQKLWQATAQENPWETTKMITHGALDILGFVPVFGAIADVANAGLYAAEGKYDMAAMSMLSAIPGVGDVLGPAAKVASKALPSIGRVASKIEKGADLINSPLGKVVTNGAPIVGMLGTAGYQAATGNGKGAMSTLTNLGLPVVGKFGGKALGNLAETANNPAAKAVFNFSGKAVSTGGMFAPAGMQAKNTYDTFGKWQRGEVGAEEVFQSGIDLASATAGVKMANRMDKRPKRERSKPELTPERQQMRKEGEALQKALPKRQQVPTEVDPALHGNTVRVHYEMDKKGQVVDVHIKAGPQATAKDIELHSAAVKRMQQYSGLSRHVQRMKDHINGWVSKNGTPPVGSKAWEAQLEVDKLPRIIEERANRLASGGLDEKSQLRLEAELASLKEQMATHEKTLQAMDKDPGSGFVAAMDRKDIKRVLDSEVDVDGNPSANKKIREAAVELRSQECVKIEIENQRKQVKEGAGKSPDNPLDASGPSARLASSEIISNRERSAWTSQIISLSSTKPKESLVSERQTYSTSPGHIYVVGGGKYQNLPTELNSLMLSTGTTPQDIAQAMQQIAKNGKVPTIFARDPEHKRHILALTRLVFDVEPGRGLAASVTLPMNLNLLKEGHLNPEQAFVSLNQMAPQGAVKVAHESDRRLGFDRIGEYKKTASERDIESMLSTEREGLSHWLLFRSQGENQIFSNEKELKELLKGGDLTKYLVQEVKHFLGQEG